MTPKERTELLVVQLQKMTLRNRPSVIEAAIRDAENDIIARVSERLESQADTLTPANAAAIARELMQLQQERFPVSCLNSMAFDVVATVGRSNRGLNACVFPSKIQMI
jgi:hypothetical protein